MLIKVIWKECLKVILPIISFFSLDTQLSLELQFNELLSVSKVSYVIIWLKVSVFTTNWQTWEFPFPHG